MLYTDDKKSKISRLIKALALDLGFEACGIAMAQPVETHYREKFSRWLEEGLHSSMKFLENHLDKRLDPEKLFPGAKSIVTLAFNYHQKNYQNPCSLYRISQYATGKDYRYVIKEKLNLLMRSLKKETGVTNFKICTDSAPVLERYWAQKAGIGHIGKNSCLILPRKGSYFFLAEILLDIELEYDNPIASDICSQCCKCVDACPTRAITNCGTIDARKCIAYLTIESKNDIIDEAFANNDNQFIFGCDICQEVCPHNVLYAEKSDEPLFLPIDAVKNWSRNHWEAIDKKGFKKSFFDTGSPIARAGYKKILQAINFVKKAQDPN